MVTIPKTDISLIGHLLRRAAFGAPASQLEQMCSTGYDALVDKILEIDQSCRLPEDLFDRFNIEHSAGEGFKGSSARWIYRMINSPFPIEEKVALMWHGRFATGSSKVANSLMMYAHMNMLRDFGLGNFKTLLQQLSRSPATLWWLDQQMNHTDAVNENYGRELLELFSMGRGNYSEEDVRSAARSFTGWTIEQTIPRYPGGWFDIDFVYRDDDHDHSQKEFLGETGDFNGDDIIDIVVRQPATGRFVATTICRFFLSDDPDERAIDTLAQAYFDSGYEIREVIRTLFKSTFFKESDFQRVKCPAELVVGTIQLTEELRDPYEFGIEHLVKWTASMGQELLNPPTVEGWHMGHEWIDSAFLIERVNFASDRLGNPSAPGVANMINRIRSDRTDIIAADLIDACLYEMGCLRLEENSRTAIVNELGLQESISCDSQLDDVANKVFQLIAASPEYQMA